MEKYALYELDAWLASLTDALESKGKVGFAVAHNFRVINEALTEYTTKKNEIITKYGEEKDGLITIVDDEKLQAADKELREFATMEVAVDILKVPESAFEASGMTARQIINLIWMIETPKEDNAVNSGNKSDKERFGFDI